MSLPKGDLFKLVELRRRLMMESCVFGPPGVEGRKLTEQIREETRLWRETWILPVLDKLIEKYSKGRGVIRND
jgi:hypothetical protein